uniref:Methyltransferase domain-containing protein n=2 Tax=Choreotrichia TaxID=141411 RepID=A0A7S3SJ10_9SPIT|mmetsp:Transcript_16311/g.49675  ORF Transcript_16311/g.49675 Transcript_16311/m.49675 type:complete len:270 (-) Transcript_16311:817-1626(-)
MFSCAEVAASLALRQTWSRNLTVELNAFHDSHTVFRHDHSRFNLLGPIGPRCAKLEHFGTGDGEKRACGLTEAVECRVISIGSNNQWDFERDLVSRTSCRVDTFDCTLNPNTHPPEDLAGRVHLHPFCIGNSNATRFVKVKTSVSKRVFLDWDSLLASIGLQGHHRLTFLKMDVEGFEYGALRSMMKSPSSLPKQIALELHYKTQFPDLSWFGRHLSAGEIALFAEELFQVGSYQVVDRNDNPHCLHCSEILLVRKPSCGPTTTRRLAP